MNVHDKKEKLGRHRIHECSTRARSDKELVSLLGSGFLACGKLKKSLKTRGKWWAFTITSRRNPTKKEFDTKTVWGSALHPWHQKELCWRTFSNAGLLLWYMWVPRYERSHRVGKFQIQHLCINTSCSNGICYLAMWNLESFQRHLKGLNRKAWIKTSLLHE